MKAKKIGPIVATGALACLLAGCAATGTPASTSEGSDATASSAAIETSNTEAAASASSAETAEAKPDAAQQDGQNSSADGQMPQGGPGQDGMGGPGQGGPGQGGPGGGMMGGGMDTQPGQTTDKGYTANDSGIAISQTLNTAEAFTERDLAQDADTSSATNLSVADGKDINITQEGIYVISGTASESTIVVDADDTAKVQLVLDGANITNTDFPAIYVKNADKVFVTLVGDNSLSVTGEFTADGDTNTDAVIFSKDDLCLNGSGSLTISTTDHGVVSKDDLKVTGGSYTIKATGSALRANDSVRISDGNFTLSGEDGIKAKNDDDNELGYVYIKGGTFDINTTGNGIQGYAFVQIDGGELKIASEECIEGTYVQVNGGTLDIDASDDGINASIKSSVYTPTIEITGGTLDINMASGDTDALDSNGYIYIEGGTVNISAQSAFDYAWGAEMTGGEVTVNGEKVTEITESMMMGGPGGGMGGPGGGMGGPGQGGQMPQDGQGSDSTENSGRPTPPDGGMGGGPGQGGGRPDGMGGPRQRPDQSGTSTEADTASNAGTAA